MGNFNPNEEQKEFLNSSDCNVLVSASAGSGKTSTMVQKLLTLLDKYKFPISSLLVVTFTNAAAAEIRQRLYIAISEHLATLDNPEDIDYFKKQLENIGNAEIGTLHSICKKLIVKYFYVIEQSPDFILLTDKEADYLFDSAMQSVFRKHISEKDKNFFELYNSYNSDRRDTSLRQMMSQLHNYLGSKPDYVEWRDSVCQDSYNEDLDNNTACNYIISQYKDKFNSTLASLDGLRKEAIPMGLISYETYLSTWIQFINEFASAKSFSQALKIYNNFPNPKKPNKIKNPSVEEEIFEERLEYARGIVKKYYDDLKKEFIHTEYDSIKEDIHIAKNNLYKIISLSDEIEMCYANLKKDRNSLDFNDLEFTMLKILENEDIRNELRSHYRFIFYDEYQDINEKQELILSKLTSGDNYYMIGDVKQSIYAFRQASPKIFISKFQKFIGDGKDNKLIKFNKNYRSEKNILAFANQVFDTLITEDTIGINYKESARFESDKELETGRVKLHLLNSSDSENNKMEAEAMAVAKEIVNVMTKKKKDGSMFEYKDIAIILRSRGDFAPILYNTLSSLQIPVTLEIEREFFGTNEIKLLVSVLKVISNYKDDLSIATTLKLLFGVTEDELLCIREGSDKKFFYEAMLEYNANDEISAKISRFIEFIDYYRMFLCSHTVSETLWDIVDRYRLIFYYKSLPNGLEREKNIIDFVIFADNEIYKYNLDKFLEYIEFATLKNLKQEIGAKGNAVEICTIHHSKGLEYPCVILCGLGRQIRTNKDSSNIIISNDFGLGLKSIDATEKISGDTIIRKACRLSNAKSEFDEEIRLLYVAMTRPREYLTMIGSYNLASLEMNSQAPIYSSASMLDLILKTYTKTDIKKIANGENIVICEGEENQSNIEITNIDDIEISSNREKGSVLLSNPNESLKNKLKDIYIHKPSSETFTIKNTVTNILREEVDYENLISTPKKLNTSDRVDGVDSLKLGTAYHLIMQNVNFNESREDIEGLVDGLIIDGQLDEELRSHINLDEIVDACTNIGKIIKNAEAVYKEKQFVMQDNYNKLVKNSDNKTKVVVQGIIDLVVVLDSGAILIDYKTNKIRDKEVLKNEYSLQLDIYKRAFELGTGIKIDKKYIYSFYQRCLIEVD